MRNELIDNAHYAAAVFHFQQDIEKIVKAIAALKGEFISGRETAAWLKLEISGEFEETKELVDFCRSLEDETNRARYPSKKKKSDIDPNGIISGKRIEKDSRKDQPDLFSPWELSLGEICAFMEKRNRIEEG